MQEDCDISKESPDFVAKVASMQCKVKPLPTHLHKDCTQASESKCQELATIMKSNQVIGFAVKGALYLTPPDDPSHPICPLIIPTVLPQSEMAFPPSSFPSSRFRELQLLIATRTSWWFGRLDGRPTPWPPPTTWAASRSLLEGMQPAESEQQVLYLLSSRSLLHQQFRCGFDCR